MFSAETLAFVAVSQRSQTHRGSRGGHLRGQRGVLPTFCCSIFVFFSLSLHPPNALGAQRDIGVHLFDIDWKKSFRNFPLYPFNLIYIYTRTLFLPLPANEFRNFPLVNEFLIFSLKSMSTDPLDPPNQTIQTILDITNIFFNRAAPPSSSSPPLSFRLITKFLPPYLPVYSLLKEVSFQFLPRLHFSLIPYDLPLSVVL